MKSSRRLGNIFTLSSQLLFLRKELSAGTEDTKGHHNTTATNPNIFVLASELEVRNAIANDSITMAAEQQRNAQNESNVLSSTTPDEALVVDCAKLGTHSLLESEDWLDLLAIFIANPPSKSFRYLSDVNQSP